MTASEAELQKQQPSSGEKRPPKATASTEEHGTEDVVPKAEESGLSQQMESLAKPKIYSENSFIVDEQLAEDECLCEVCCDLIDLGFRDYDDGLSCRHKICQRCWKLHLTAKLQQENLSQQVNF